ncbi:hypothetical protein F442_02807 [Phytophthora nicotianae P10297]|uniref:Uncharacterized protein n=1 Tax=Phytophthora nicotianae P10297 TaxID=1317064 RepID=W2ZYQ3_PHYNI|nr:hypothetical protein F442_02807 [Phytophthora nicotianae P10297]
MESLRDFLAESINATTLINLSTAEINEVCPEVKHLKQTIIDAMDKQIEREYGVFKATVSANTRDTTALLGMNGEVGVSEQCRDFAAKTVAGLEKGSVKRMAKDDAGHFIPEEDHDHPENYHEEEEENGKCKSKATKTYGKKTSTARPKPAAKATTALKTLNMKKPRMPTSVKIAKEKGKAARVAAFGENRCAASGAAEVDEIAVMTEARNRHDEIADTKTKKKKKSRTIQNTSSATPPTTTTLFTSNALKTTIVTGPHKKKRKPVPSLPLPDDENSIKLIVSAITKHMVTYNLYIPPTNITSYNIIGDNRAGTPPSTILSEVLRRCWVQKTMSTITSAVKTPKPSSALATMMRKVSAGNKKIEVTKKWTEAMRKWMAILAMRRLHKNKVLLQQTLTLSVK